MGHLREFSRRFSDGGSSSSSSDDSKDCIYSFQVQDQAPAIIRVSCFGAVARALQPVLKLGELYKFSKFDIRPVPRGKASLDSHYEVELTDVTNVKPLEDDGKFPALLPESFTLLKKIRSLQDEQKICKY